MCTIIKVVFVVIMRPSLGISVESAHLYQFAAGKYAFAFALCTAVPSWGFIMSPSFLHVPSAEG